MNDQKFFRCRHCGNLVGMLNFSGRGIECCEETMEALEAEPSNEHFSEIARQDDKLKVTVAQTKHLLRWIYLQTEFGGQRKSFSADEKREERQKTFFLGGERPIAIYAYDDSGGLQRTKL